jgi:hypothetical protein
MFRKGDSSSIAAVQQAATVQPPLLLDAGLRTAI